MSITRKESDRMMINLNPSASARQLGKLPNPGNESQLNESNPLPEAGWYVGEVISSFPGTYTSIVRLNGSREIELPCVLAGQCSNALSGTGVNSAVVPIEGTYVLVYKPNGRSPFGFIVAAIPPYTSQGAPAATLKFQIPSIDPEPAGGFSTERAYYGPYVDTNNMSTVVANGCRPLDVYPGQTAEMNELGVGWYIGTLMASLRGSERCGVDVFATDDLLRLYSGQFQHFNALGEEHIYNDGGYQTFEWTGSPHMCETLGYHGYDQKWLVPDMPDGKKMDNSDRKLASPDQCLHRRYQMYMGHLCGIFSLFVSNPDPTVAPNTHSTKTMDQGLFSVNVDPSGRLMVSAAGDIILERTDRIPIPKKLKEAWDPTGELVDLVDPFQEKRPFTWRPDVDPRSRQLWLRDGMAWYKHLLYQRMDEAQKDWYVPEEADLRIPDNEYEKVGKLLGSELFNSVSDRRAVICMGMDGTIILRADGGAEVVLAGGDIQFNAPGDIRLQAGQNVVSLSRDVVLRARDSVDVVATNKDIRLKSERNLHLYSERSILLQSNAKNDGHNWASDTKGEDQIHGGIALVARNSRVFLNGMLVHLAGARQIILETLDTAVGMIKTVTGTALNLFQSLWNISKQGGGQMIAKGHGIYGESVMTAGVRSNVMVRGNKMAAISPWVDAGRSPYNDFWRVGQPLITTYLDSTTWLNDYAPIRRAKIQFTYRTPKQYGTEKGAAIGPGDGAFRLYEPYWVYAGAAGKGPAWLPRAFEAWNEKPIVQTYPWPGSTYYESATGLVRLEGEVNWLNYTKPKKRKDRTNVGQTLPGMSVAAYRIPKG